MESSVRGGRVPERLQGRHPAGGCRSHGRPLQHDQLGPPLDAGLELRRDRFRSPHGRDHQGDGDPRVAARSAGLHDFRGLVVAVHERQREAGDPVRDRAEAHPPARGPRGRPHPWPWPQLLRQHQGVDLGDGLPPSARKTESGWHRRPVRRVSRSNRRLGQGDDQLRLPAVRVRHRREGGAHEDPRRRVGAGHPVHDESGHRFAPQGGSVVQRRQSGRRAESDDEDPPRRARAHRRAYDSHRRSDGDDRRAAGAHLHVSPLLC